MFSPRVGSLELGQGREGQDSHLCLSSPWERKGRSVLRGNQATGSGGQELSLNSPLDGLLSVM